MAGRDWDTDRLRGRRKEELTHEQRMALANRNREDSSAQCVRLLYETMDMGDQTSAELYRQAESLDRTEAHLDKMDVDLEQSRRNMREVKSVFGSFVNNLTKPKFTKSKTPKTSSPPAPVEKSGKGSGARRGGGGGGGGGKKGQAQVQEQRNESTGNATVDRNLDELERGLRMLEGQAYLIGSQLDESNAQIDRIQVKMEDRDIRVKKMTRDIKGEL